MAEETASAVVTLRGIRRHAARTGVTGGPAAQIERLLAWFGLVEARPAAGRRPSSSLERFAAVHRSAGEVGTIAPWLLAAPQRRHYTRLSVAEFGDLVDAVRTLDRVGGRMTSPTAAG